MLAWLWQRLSNGGPGVTVSGRALRRFTDPDVDRLLRSRVLIEQPKTDIWPVCVHCECGLDTRPIREIHGQLRACCPYDPAEDEVLEPDDLRRFRIDADRVANAIATVGGLGPAECIGSGFWLLGTDPSGRAIVLAQDNGSLAAPGTAPLIRSAAACPVIVILSDTFTASERVALADAGFEPVLLAEAMIVDADGAERLALEFPPHEISSGAPAATGIVSAPVVRLELGRSDQTVRFEGHDYILSSTGFRALLGVAEAMANGKVMLTYQDLYSLTNREHRDVIREIREKFQQHGLSRQATFDLIKVQHGRGLVLGLAPQEIVIRD